MVTLPRILISISKILIPHFLELIALTSTRLSLVGPKRNHHCTNLHPKVQHEGFEHVNYDTRPKVRLRIEAQRLFGRSHVTTQWITELPFVMSTT